MYYVSNASTLHCIGSLELFWFTDPQAPVVDDDGLIDTLIDLCVLNGYLILFDGFNNNVDWVKMKPKILHCLNFWSFQVLWINMTCSEAYSWPFYP